MATYYANNDTFHEVVRNAKSGDTIIVDGKIFFGPSFHAPHGVIFVGRKSVSDEQKDDT